MRESPHFFGRRGVGECHLQVGVDRKLGDELGVVRFEESAASFAQALDLREEGEAAEKKEARTWSDGSASGRASGGLMRSRERERERKRKTHLGLELGPRTNQHGCRHPRHEVQIPVRARRQPLGQHRPPPHALSHLSFSCLVRFGALPLGGEASEVCLGQRRRRSRRRRSR